MRKDYVLVGNWSFESKRKGLSSYLYNPDTGSMTFLNNCFQDKTVGQQAVNREKGLIYFVDECEDQHGMTGGGGYIGVLQIDKDMDSPVILSERPSMGVNPCYICLDNKGKYLLLTNHGRRNHATRTIKKTDGSIGVEVLFDDTSLILFRLNEDGTVGEPCDAYVPDCKECNGKKIQPHFHSVAKNPSGKIYVVCDKGLDKIQTFALDEENGKLKLLDDVSVPEGYAPHYSVFHPEKPIFYQNNEHNDIVQVYSYEEATGKIHLLQSISVKNEMFDFISNNPAAGDIKVHPNGKFLYASVRNENYLAALCIQEDGRLELMQTINCGGIGPRGISFSEDARFLFVANTESRDIYFFSIDEKGFLHPKGVNAIDECPGTIQFLAVN